MAKDKNKDKDKDKDKNKGKDKGTKASEKKSKLKSSSGPDAVRALVRVGPAFDLRKVSADKLPGAPKNSSDARKQIEALEEETTQWHERLWAESKGGAARSLLLVFQGMDTSGKGGAGKAVDRLIDPLGFSIVSFGPPTKEEKAHPYIWRYAQQTPERGRIRMFDRSHYESVLIERVRNLAPKKEWSKRYGEINEWEKSLVDGGTRVVKFMLHISKDEQKVRLGERLADPTKYWKYNPGDVDERALWDDYMDAYQDALVKCSTDHAPWHVIPADQKWLRDWLISQILVETMREMNPQYPAATFDVELEKKRVEGC